MGLWLEILSLELLLIIYCFYFHFYLSSPYLCVFGNDHVTRYMGAEVDAGEYGDT